MRIWKTARNFDLSATEFTAFAVVSLCMTVRPYFLADRPLICKLLIGYGVMYQKTSTDNIINNLLIHHYIYAAPVRIRTMVEE